MAHPQLPLVYACSGCSSVAQLANDLAVTLDRQGLAEMSCIAGVGGDVPALVRVAQSGRPILAVDGCALNCVRNSLQRHQVTPALHLELTALGFTKRAHGDCDLRDCLRLLTLVQTQFLPALPAVRADS
ncbi:MAG: zinc-binding protein [Corallincola sp.]|nr:zinc-binding protein [Corallincola sp.]